GWQERLEWILGQVVDVMVFGNHVAFQFFVDEIDSAVNLENHRALFEKRVLVRVRVAYRDRVGSLAGLLMPKRSPAFFLGEKKNQIVGLSDFVERLLHQVVIVR